MLIIGLISMFGQNIHIAELSFNNLLNKSNSVGLNTSTLKIQYPLNLKKRIFVNGISFSNYEVDYNANETINTNTISSFKTISYSLEYLNILTNNWNYNLELAPSISSNFESNVSFRDVLFNGTLSFTKTKNRSKLTLGVTVNSNFGLTVPIPIISYSKNVSEKFQYTIGIPKTAIQFTFNNRNKTKFYVEPKGFVANLSNNLNLENGVTKKAKYQSLIAGIMYHHKIDDFWKISLNAGCQLLSNFNLENGNKDVYEFNTKQQFFVGVGLKFN